MQSTHAAALAQPHVRVRGARRRQHRIAKSLSIVRTHVAMFGIASAVRAGLGRLVTPKYTREDFDRVHGVDTETASVVDSEIPLDWFADALRYEAPNVRVLHHLFRSLPFRLEACHLVDVGCGKGRTLLVAAEYPFRAITGVELSPVSAQIARRNLARAVRRTVRCRRIEVSCENAVDFAVPSGNVLVTMYNPFVGQTFQQCIEHLHHAAIEEPGRSMWIAYINPSCEETLARSGYFRHVCRHRPIAHQWTWSLWRHVRTRGVAREPGRAAITSRRARMRAGRATPSL